jgi:hypothetical protein
MALERVVPVQVPDILDISKVKDELKQKGITNKQLDEYKEFLREVNERVMSHPVIQDNEYTQWFARGEATFADVRHMVQQFSVFSHLFLIAALKKMINARSLETYRATKEILANEIGVIYRNRNKPIPKTTEISDDAVEEGVDPKYAETQGTVDGGVFRFKAGHYEWLLRLGEFLDLDFNTMGKPWLGTEKTIFFCDELARLYGSEDPNIAEGASFAVENWAAAGFWKELVSGLEKFKEREGISQFPIAFFTFHDKLEGQHAEHVADELAEVYFEEGFDKEKFITGGIEMLDGVKAFWDGLNEDRKKNK